MLQGDAESSVPNATKLLADDRVTQFWDGKKELGAAYKDVLGIDRTAWDVYILYGPDAEWKEQPPKPSFWMHQLGIEQGQPLNGELMADEVRKLFSSEKK